MRGAVLAVLLAMVSAAPMRGAPAPLRPDGPPPGGSAGGSSAELRGAAEEPVLVARIQERHERVRAGAQHVGPWIAAATRATLRPPAVVRSSCIAALREWHAGGGRAPVRVRGPPALGSA